MMVDNSYLWQAEIYMHSAGVHAKEHFLRHRTALVGLYAALMFLLALSSKLNLVAHTRAARAEVQRRRRCVQFCVSQHTAQALPR